MAVRYTGASMGRVLLLLMVTGAARAQCPFAVLTNLVGDIGQFPTNWINQVATFTNAKGSDGKFPALVKKWQAPKLSAPSSCSPSQYEAIAQEVKKSVSGGDVAAPTLQRMAFHTCGTWSASAQNGGCSGAWHMYDADRDFPVNAGILSALDLMKPIKSKFPCISMADLYTFAGVVAQEVAGGPPGAWHPGRRDSAAHGPKAPPFSARLPDGMFNGAGVLYAFLNYGLTMRELVALNGGGHSFGGAAPTNSGWNGTFTSAGDSWPKPANTYFRDLVSLGWKAELVKTTGRLQFVPHPGQKAQYTNVAGKQVFRLPSDMALRESPNFSFWTTAYALNETLFLEDYTRVWQRTLQWGAGITFTIDPKAYTWKGLKGNAKDWGTDIQPQLDTENVPKNVPADKAKYLALMDPSKAGVVNVQESLADTEDNAAAVVLPAPGGGAKALAATSTPQSEGLVQTSTAGMARIQQHTQLLQLLLIAGISILAPWS